MTTKNGLGGQSDRPFHFDFLMWLKFIGFGIRAQA